MNHRIIDIDYSHLNLSKRIEVAVDQRLNYFLYNDSGRKLREQNQTNQAISNNYRNLIEKPSPSPCSMTLIFDEVMRPNPIVEKSIHRKGEM